jgi:lysyl-tRNA synthetase class 2
MTKNTWQPTASTENLKKRAEIITQIREFFASRNVLEVETPLLSKATVTDVHLHSLKTTGNLYLQTSPEYAMKRLLANGSSSIYQICKAFRDDESGRLHNLEFTILEWYRVGFNHHQLMDEMDELLQLILSMGVATRYSYQEIFEKFLKINPHNVDVATLQSYAREHKINLAIDDKDALLQLLVSEVIEPKLKDVVFIYDYPASQAALAKIRKAKFPVAERFEVYVDGIELANGFHELQDAREQRQRFLNDLEKRQQLGYPKIPLDENFLASLEYGLPACAGVALGVDRLIMLALGVSHISQVLSFNTNI